MNTAHASASPNQTLDSIHQKPPAQLAKKQGETEHDVPSTASEKKKSGSYASKAIPRMMLPAHTVAVSAAKKKNKAQ